MDAAVTLVPRTCMQTLTPLMSAPTRAGGRWTGPRRPGAPHGPVPWSRRWAAVAAAVSPPEAAAARKRRLAARRTSAYAVSSPWSRKRPKSSPGARPAEAARPVGTEHESGWRWRRRRAERGDRVVGARRLEHEGLGRVGDRGTRSRRPPDAAASAMPPCPHVSSSPVITSTASAALRARSRPRRTRSMPISAGVRRGGVVCRATRSLPMATPCSLTPCSAPHSHVGQDRNAACAPASPMVRYCVRSVQPAERPPAEGPGDLDLAGRTVRVLGEHHARRPGAHSVSHMVAV